MGCKIDSSCFKAAGSSKTLAPKAFRSIPFGVITFGKMPLTKGTAAPSLPIKICTAASESNTGISALSNIFAVSVFPIPIDPVRPITVILSGLITKPLKYNDEDFDPLLAPVQTSPERPGPLDIITFPVHQHKGCRVILLVLKAAFPEGYRQYHIPPP